MADEPHDRRARARRRPARRRANSACARAGAGARPAARGSRRGSSRPARLGGHRSSSRSPVAGSNTCASAGRGRSATRVPLLRRVRASRCGRRASTSSSPSSATQKTNASAPTSSTTSTSRGDPLRRELERLGPEADDELALPFEAPRGQRHLHAAEETAPFAPSGTRAEVHRRRADEAGDEHVRRPVVELARRAELLQPAVVQRRRRDGRASSPRTGRASRRRS